MTRTSKRRRGSSSLDDHSDSDPSQTSHAAADYLTQIKTLERQLAANSEEVQRLQKENAEQQCRIFTLSTRLSAAELEFEFLRESTNKAIKYRDNVLMQQNLRYENSVLKGQLNHLGSQRQIIALAATDSVRLPNRRVHQELEQIATDLKDACSSVEITSPPTSLNTSTETEFWTQRIARCSFGQFSIDSDDSKFYVARALAAAGISELVFESRLLDFLPWESPLLDQYRSHILARSKVPPCIYYPLTSR